VPSVTKRSASEVHAANCRRCTTGKGLYELVDLTLTTYKVDNRRAKLMESRESRWKLDDLLADDIPDDGTVLDKDFPLALVDVTASNITAAGVDVRLVAAGCVVVGSLSVVIALPLRCRWMPPVYRATTRSVPSIGGGRKYSATDLAQKDSLGGIIEKAHIV
jgi:hypothetical protein